MNKKWRSESESESVTWQKTKGVICCRCENRAKISGESRRDCATYQLSFLTLVFAVIPLTFFLFGLFSRFALKFVPFGFCALVLLFSNVLVTRPV